MNVLSPVAVLTDFNGNPLSATPTATLNTAQSSILCSGVDYTAATPKAQVLKVDANGQQYSVSASASGTALPLGVNTAGTLSGSFGIVQLAWDASTSTWRPLAVDSSGASISKSTQFLTCNWSPSATVATTTTAGRSMISFYNNSTSSIYQRWVSGYFTCPPQSNTTGGLAGIGSGTSYTPIYFEMHRFTTLHTGGTAVTAGVFDPADASALDTAFTCRYGATISGETTPVLTQWDAAYDGTKAIGMREDTLGKLIVIPPASGLHVKCISALSTSVSFQIRVQTIQGTV